MLAATAQAVRNHIITALGAKTSLPQRLRSRIEPLTVPLDPDEGTGFKLYNRFRGATNNAASFSCHVSVLVQGHSPHPPHTHSEEEILIMLAGEADLILPQMASSAGTTEVRLKPGQFVYYPAQFPHTLRAVSAEPANYLMFKWRAAYRTRNAQLAFGLFDAADFFSSGNNASGFSASLVFEGRTRSLDTLHAHVTTLGPGAGYESHIDPYDAAIVLLQGEVETLGQRVRPHGIIFYAAGDPHGMHNPSPERAQYVVFEFHGRVPFLRKVADIQRWKRKLKSIWHL